jgi:hypothetical protein
MHGAGVIDFAVAMRNFLQAKSQRSKSKNVKIVKPVKR